MSGAAEVRPRGRLLGSDALRAVATVWVVIIHAAAWGPGSGYESALILARFSVPTFTVLTGLLLAYRYSDRPLGRDFARARLARTVVPWFAWIPVYVVLDVAVFHTLPGAAGNIVHFVAQGGGHLWYLLLIPELYVVFALWPRRHTVVLAAVAMLVQTALALWHLFGPLPQGWVETLILEYGFLLFPFWVGYFAVGMAIGRLWRPIPARLRLALSLLGPFAIIGSGWLLTNVRFQSAQWVTFLDGTGSFLNPLLPLLVFSIAAWVLAVAPLALHRSVALQHVVKYLSDYSLGIYIIHPIALYYMGNWYSPHLQEPPLQSLLWFLFIVAGCLLFSLVVTRIIVATPLAPVVGMQARPLTSAGGAHKIASRHP